MPTTANLDPKSWTYGAEHEFGDWDTRGGWEGFGRDPEPNICNSNGIAGDPTLKDWPYGAEINSPPTDTPEGQGAVLEEFIGRYPDVTVSQRSGLHIHIRVPGLRDDLEKLKLFQKYIGENASCYPLIDPVPIPLREHYCMLAEYDGARRWVRMIKRSHWTKLSEARLTRQLEATTVDEFYALEAPFTKKTHKPMWHAQPRLGVSLRQLLQSNTIEFRHFFGTTKPRQVVLCCGWCKNYLLSALDNYPATELYYRGYAGLEFPERPQYCHWLERRWEATSYSKVKRKVAEANRLRILDGSFDDLLLDGGTRDEKVKQVTA